MEEFRFPTTHRVHWPTGPVDCCKKHAAKLVKVGSIMGYVIAVTELDPEDWGECINCINEDYKSKTNE